MQRALEEAVSYGYRQLAQIIDGKAIATQLRANLAQRVADVRLTRPDFTPGLAIVQVGDRPDSNVYIRNKLAASTKVGINAEHFKLPPNTTAKELIKHIDHLNANPSVHGIIVQLPLDTTERINTDDVINRINPHKDVDGLTRDNAGMLSRGELANTIVPCTPRGCLHLVESTGIPVAGSEVVVLGRSKIVGSPLAELFLWNHGTVTVCHSRTQDLKAVCQRADILLVAIGQRELVKGDWLKPSSVVIDCGISVLPNGKLTGDVEFESAREVAGHVTPVPGGVGPMTIAMLLQNTVEQAIKAL